MVDQFKAASSGDSFFDSANLNIMTNKSIAEADL
jgi:hypothetical protein